MNAVTDVEPDQDASSKENPKNDTSDVLISSINNLQAVIQSTFENLQKTLNQVPLRTDCDRCGRSGHIAAVCCSRTTDEIQKRAGLRPLTKNPDPENQVVTPVISNTPTKAQISAIQTLTAPISLTSAPVRSVSNNCELNTLENSSETPDIYQNSLDYEYMDYESDSESEMPNSTPELKIKSGNELNDFMLIHSLGTHDSNNFKISSQIKRQPSFQNRIGSTSKLSTITSVDSETFLSDPIITCNSKTQSLSSPSEPLIPTPTSSTINTEEASTSITQLNIARISRPTMVQPGITSTAPTPMTAVPAPSDNNVAAKFKKPMPHDRSKLISLSQPNFRFTYERPEWIEDICKAMKEVHIKIQKNTQDIQGLQNGIKRLIQSHSSLKHCQLTNLASSVHEVERDVVAVKQRLNSIEPNMQKLGKIPDKYQEPVQSEADSIPLTSKEKQDTTTYKIGTKNRQLVQKLTLKEIKFSQSKILSRHGLQDEFPINPVMVTILNSLPHYQTRTTPIYDVSRTREYASNQTWKDAEICLHPPENKKEDHVQESCQRRRVPVQLFDPECQASNRRWPGYKNGIEIKYIEEDIEDIPETYQRSL